MKKYNDCGTWGSQWLKLTFKHFIKIPLKLTWATHVTAGTASLFTAKKKKKGGLIGLLLETICHSLFLWDVGNSAVFSTVAQGYKASFPGKKQRTERKSSEVIATLKRWWLRYLIPQKN